VKLYQLLVEIKRVLFLLKKSALKRVQVDLPLCGIGNELRHLQTTFNASSPLRFFKKKLLEVNIDKKMTILISS